MTLEGKIVHRIIRRQMCRFTSHAKCTCCSYYGRDNRLQLSHVLSGSWHSSTMFPGLPGLFRRRRSTRPNSPARFLQHDSVYISDSHFCRERCIRAEEHYSCREIFECRLCHHVSHPGNPNDNIRQITSHEHSPDLVHGENDRYDHYLVLTQNAALSRPATAPCFSPYLWLTDI